MTNTMIMRRILSAFLFASAFYLFGCTTKKCVEKPREDCICTMEYNPVCGCNDKTYSNACEAECHGITDYTKGACEKDVK